MAKNKKRPLYEQIKELESKGYKVDINHIRVVSELSEAQKKFTKREYSLNSKGGITTAHIYDDFDKEISSGVAYCSMKDNYNKKLGALIALGRAKKAAGLR